MKMERHPWGFRFSFWKTFKAGGAARRAGVDPPSDAAGSASQKGNDLPPLPLVSIKNKDLSFHTGMHVNDEYGSFFA